jgi:hypothetical protein
MASKDGGPAYPLNRDRAVDGSTYNDVHHSGMSLRDYFAAQALCGWYTNSGGLPNEDYLENYAKHFYLMADAMLKARDLEVK